MIVITAGPGSSHRPPFELDNGQMTPAYEVPERVDTILSAVARIPNVQVTTPPNIDPMVLHSVHQPDYVEHIRSASEELRSADATAAVSYPSVFPARPDQIGRGSRGRRGQFASDTYTPLLPSTFEVSLWAAASAIAAAAAVSQGDGQPVYALCRPPGHHAEPARSGGYCYFNNAALAVQRLVLLGRVAVLDVDVHHGNGTQQIFYDRDDVATISIHGDPSDFYPYFSGFEDEMGTGRGLGMNRNIPLPRNTSEAEYQSALESVMEWIEGRRPAFLVVAFGADTHESDPIGCFKLTTAYYSRMARTIRQLGTPVLVVQEGGYNLEFLGQIVSEFLSGLTGIDAAL